MDSDNPTFKKRMEKIPMIRTAQIALAALALCVSATSMEAGTISGNVLDSAGKPMEGVMISAFTVESGKRKSVSVFSQADGSFSIEGLFYEKYYKVRARLMGQLDAVKRDVKAGESKLSFSMKPATGEDLEDQRTADSGFDTWLTVDEGSNRVTEQVLYDVLEMLKDQVRHQGWKDRYE